MGLLEELPSERKTIVIKSIKVEKKVYDELTFLKENGVAIDEVIVLALKKLPVSKLVKEIKDLNAKSASKSSTKESKEIANSDDKIGIESDDTSTNSSAFQ